jgi:hypothetical protein
LQGVIGKINQSKSCHPSSPPNLSAVNQKKPKENLGSLPSHGWIPDPEIYMCQKKKKKKTMQEQLNQTPKSADFNKETGSSEPAGPLKKS